MRRGKRQTKLQRLRPELLRYIIRCHRGHKAWENRHFVKAPDVNEHDYENRRGQRRPEHGRKECRHARHRSYTEIFGLHFDKTAYAVAEPAPDLKRGALAPRRTAA